MWWERLTQCYLVYTDTKALSSEQKQAVFRILFQLGMGGDLRAIAPDLARLSGSAAQEILALIGEGTQ